MKTISNFMLPENTNQLYKNEAISSISLTRDVAVKINELVAAINELSKEDLEWKQEQDGRTRKAILYMKDNLVNSLNELTEHLIASGFVDVRIAANLSTLTARLNNLLGTVTTGSTTMDAEVIDLRTDSTGQVYSSAGECIRYNQKSYMNYMDGVDINTLTSKSMYCVVSQNSLNIPEKTSGLLDVQLFHSTYKGNYFVLQTWYGVNSGNTYYRTKHVDSVWTEWKDITNGKSDVNYISAGDLNTHYDGNKYCIVGADILNNPEEALGMLEVQYYKTANNNFWTMQTWKGITTGNEFYRTYRDGVWTDWFKVNSSGGSVMNGKKVVFIGDSIFGLIRDASGVVSQIASKTGALCYNFAFGGTRAKSRDGAWGKFDGEALASSIASGNFTEQETALPNMSDAPSYFSSMLDSLKTFDFSSVDYLVCNYGTNDWFSGNTPSSDYKVAMKSIIETIQKTFPNIIVIKCTPTQRFIGSGNDYEDAGSYSNTANENLKKICEIDKAIGEEMCIQVIDCFNIGINIHNKDHYFSDGDYVHHDVEGRRRLAAYISNNLC